MSMTGVISGVVTPHGCSDITIKVENNPRTQIFFSTIADEVTDVSSKEQLSLCLRSVDESLNAFEDFIGFYQLENIKSNSIVHVIKEHSR